MLNNGIADKDDYDFPIGDLKTLLSGDEIKKIDTDWEHHEFDDIYFYLPEEYELNNEEDGIQTYIGNDKVVQIIRSEKFADYFDDETFASYVEILNEDSYDLSTRLDVYFSRKCNYFYKTKGTCESNDKKYNAEVYICLDDSDEMITFIFYSTTDFEEGVNEQILNDAIF